MKAGDVFENPVTARAVVGSARQTDGERRRGPASAGWR
jgi:hypothetical protein